MMHPHTILREVNPTIGHGVFATRLIPRGTIVYAKDRLDVELPPDHPLIHHPFYEDTIEKYSYIEPNGTRVICWDIGKYVNHCCQPSTLTTGYGFELAIQDIEPGEEITDDYGIFNSMIPLPVSCHEQNCRGCVRLGDFDRCHTDWDRKIQAALADFRRVEQPLLPLVDRETIASIGRYIDTSDGYHSVCHRKHPDPNKLYRQPSDRQSDQDPKATKEPAATS